MNRQTTAEDVGPSGHTAAMRDPVREAADAYLRANQLVRLTAAGNLDTVTADQLANDPAFRAAVAAAVGAALRLIAAEVRGYHQRKLHRLQAAAILDAKADDLMLRAWGGPWPVRQAEL